MSLLWDSRYGIMPMAAPGIAGQYPFNREVTSFEEPMFLQGFHAVLGTGRSITALGAQQRGDAPLVEPDKPYERVT
jgi:hypothetical protein